MSEEIQKNVSCSAQSKLSEDSLVCSLQNESTIIEPVIERNIKRFRDGQWQSEAIDMVSNEVPVALVFNGISHTVMMATPRDLDALALGFALSEGIIEAAHECYGVEVVHINAEAATKGLTAACEVRLEISSRQFLKLKEHRRTLAGRTGCGVCGVESLTAFELDTPKVKHAPWVNDVKAEKLLDVFEALPLAQVLNRQTGSIHAAGWVDTAGVLVKVMEDVGRHNALDKLLGWRAQEEGKGEEISGFVVMTSRASYELIRKCAFLDVPVLATISAPTSLAINMAQAAGIRLFGLCRKGQVVQYCA